MYAFAERKYSASMDNKTTTIEQAFFNGGFILFFDIYTEFVAVEWKSRQRAWSQCTSRSSIGCWFPETPSIKSIWSFLKYQHIESKTWTWWNMSNWNMYLIWNAPKNASKKTRMTSHKEGENYRISWIGGNTVPTIRFLLLKEAFLRVNVWKKRR